MARFAILLCLAVSTAPAWAQTKTVTGQMGILGEWELTATLSATDDTRGWSGPLNLKHVGFCSADGPEEKLGELRLPVADPVRELAATIVIDGSSCTFKGRLADAWEGVLSCPNRRDVPMMLILQ